MGSGAADTAGALDFAVGNTEKATSEIGGAGSFDRADIHDPQQQLDYKREKIEGEHQGLRGVAGSVYSAFGWQPSYQQEMDELTEAQQYSAAGDTKFSADSNAQQQNARLQQLRAQLDATAASETKTQFQLQRESIDRNYTSQVRAADDVTNDKTFWSQGFKSPAEANAFAEHLRQSASAIHDAEFDKLEGGELIELGSDQTRLNMLNKAAAGDTTGAARTALENQLDSEEDATDPNDKERLQRFGAIRQQTLANFDADAARRELQRTNAQASALDSTQHGGLGSNVEDLAGRLADTARKLDDAATKLDKVFSNAKTSTLLED
jgi:hypothetical protein